jgi:uncharacterized protein
MFLSREHEIKLLNQLWLKNTSSLVVFTGRRRIGKSTLAEEFAKTAKHFIQIQGLAPAKGITPVSQLENFAEELHLFSKQRKLHLKNWTEAWDSLNESIGLEKTVVLIDEISWMAKDSPTFASKLKNAWDSKLKKNKNLIFIICGSVSSWIEYNILKKTAFVGRISLRIHLNEIPINQVSAFWKKKNISVQEKFKFLAISGGVPRYLEELIPNQTTASNLQRLCFEPGGFFIDEFEKIFNDTFDTRAPIYKKILKLLVQKNMNFVDICSSLKVQKNGAISDYLEDLTLSGFISRNYKYTTKGKATKESFYRISDTYIRFYLKYLEPHKNNIEKGLYKNVNIETLPHWNQMLGFQFETLILKNMDLVLKKLEINPQEVTSYSPHTQRSTTRTKGACQIDLLITTKYGNIYVCEIKFKKQISANIVEEVEQKIKVLKRPKSTTIRPVLIYLGELDEDVTQADFFAHFIDAGEWLK